MSSLDLDRVWFVISEERNYTSILHLSASRRFFSSRCRLPDTRCGAPPSSASRIAPQATAGACAPRAPPFAPRTLAPAAPMVKSVDTADLKSAACASGVPVRVRLGAPDRMAAHSNAAPNKKSLSRHDQERLLRIWRRGPESNRAERICNPVHNRFATAPWVKREYPPHRRLVRTPSQTNRSRTAKRKRALRLQGPSSGYGAGNEARTRDLNLGKVALYQLSYSRVNRRCQITLSARLLFGVQQSAKT